MRLAVLVAAGASFFMAVSVPHAFGATGLWFAATYLVVRLMMLALYLLGARNDPERRGAMARLAPWFLAGPLPCWPVASSTSLPRRILWTASLAVDVAGTFRAASGGWRVSPAHFAERYGLFIIIALGESMVAIGATAAGLPIEGILFMAVTLAMAGAMALWWAYFDFAARGMERALRAVTGAPA